MSNSDFKNNALVTSSLASEAAHTPGAVNTAWFIRKSGTRPRMNDIVSRERQFSIMEKKASYISLLPVELWIIILTEALRPVLSLDTYCFSSGMEKYHRTIAEDIFRRGDERDQHVIARRSLCLVCKHFNGIIKIIPKPPRRGWILEEDNYTPSYHAPVPHWTVSGHWERIDLRLDFVEASMVTVSYPPVTTFRLFVRHEAQEPLLSTAWNPMGFIQHATDIISQPNSLEVLHLQLEYCYCKKPSEFIQCIEMISHLTTLSLCLGMSNIRDMIYEPLSLPRLRVLFLKFPVFGTRDTALQLWTFTSLDILSLDLRIARSGVVPVPSIPTYISLFIQRHGSHLYGLRLQPGPWSAPRNDRYLQPMDPEAEKKLWQQLPELKALSAEFTHFSMGSAKRHSTGESPFRNLVTLSQIGMPMSSNLLARLAEAIFLCPALQAVHIPSPPQGWRREAAISQCEPDLLTLENLCRRRNVSLYY